MTEGAFPRNLWDMQRGWRLKQGQPPWPLSVRVKESPGHRTPQAPHAAKSRTGSVCFRYGSHPAGAAELPPSPLAFI